MIYHVDEWGNIINYNELREILYSHCSGYSYYPIDNPGYDEIQDLQLDESIWGDDDWNE